MFMASTSALIANLATRTFDASRKIPVPHFSSQTVTVDTSQVSDEPALRFRFSALNNSLPLVQSKDLQNRKYIAQGACSQVIAASLRGKIVAVKRILKTTLLQHEKNEKQQMILDKISGLQQDLEVCLHPALKESGYFPELLGYGTQDDLPFLVMEYAECGSLMRMLYTDQTWATRRSVINDIAIGLEALHTNGFTHGDVKLENVLVFRDTDGTLIAKLSDFSLATLPSSEAEHRSVYYGSWPWRPIECWTDERVTSLESCDVWAFAFALWRVAQYRNDDSVRMLNFVPKPAQGTQECNLSSWTILKRRVVHELSNCDTVDKHNRQSVARLFEKCVETKPEDRPNTEGIVQAIGNMMFEPETHETGTPGRTTFDPSVTKHGPPRSFQSVVSESEKDSLKQNAPIQKKHALQGDLSLFRIIHDRGSWKAQKDFFHYICDLKDNGVSKIQHPSLKELLVAMCQLSGFGCRKDVALIKRLLDQSPQDSPVAAPREDGIMPLKEAEKALLSHYEMLLGEAAVELQERDGFSYGDESLLAEVTELTECFTSLELDKFHSNMLWSACRNGHAVAAMYLCSYFDPNERDLDYGSTPLHLLFKIPELHMQKLAETMVACGANPDLSSNGKSPYVDEESHLVLEGTPLDWSIKAGSHKAVQCLLAIGADALTLASGMTPLCRAVTLYRSDIIRCIINRIGRIEKLMTSKMKLGKIGFEILYGFGPQLFAECERAVLYGDKIAHAANEALDTVLEHLSEDPSHFLDLLLYQTLTPEVQYTTAVLVPYLTELFIEKGAHVVPRFTEGSTPLLHRLAKLWIRDGDNCESLLETLLQRFSTKFDVNLKDSGGRTALHEAAIYNAYPLVSILLRHGANMDAEDADYCTPLALAGCMASAEVFEQLLHNGARIQLQDGNVLHQCCMARTPTSIIPLALIQSVHRHKFLQSEILEGIMASVQTTPLGIAVHNGDVEAVKVLLQCGANPRAPFNIPGWGAVISVREDATLLRHRPELSAPIYTWQRREWVGEDKRVDDIREIQKILYRNCKESDYEEPDMMHISGGKSQSFMMLQARPRRQGEWYSEPLVSIDVLGQRPSKVGCSMWEEIDLREDEYVEHRMMMLAPRPEPGQQLNGPFNGIRRKDYQWVLNIRKAYR